MTYSLQSGTFDHYYKEALRQEFLKRIQRTAKHDYEDAEFHGPKGYGDQSPIRPIKPETLSYEASDRIIELSRPTPDRLHHMHKPFIKSYLSNKNGTKRYMTSHMKKAVDEASKPKQHLSNEKLASPTIKRKVKISHTIKLAQPKVTNTREMCQNYHTRPTVNKVNEHALNYQATDRIKKLASPKTYTLNNIIWTPSNSKKPVSDKKVNFNHIKKLAKPKAFHPDYVPPKKLNEAFQVSTAAINNHPRNTRLNQLSTPIIRPNIRKIRFKSDAYLISPNALRAVPTTRLKDLAQPIKRD